MPLSARMLLQNDLLELKLDEQILADCAEAEFVSEHPKKSVLSDLPKTEITDKNTLRVAFQNHDIPPDFNGVLLCPGHAYYVTPENDLAPLPTAPEPTNTLWYYLLTAFIAGLILNLMPCVLPVLSLKALYLAAHKEKASILSGLSYLSGVLCSFVVLAALIFCFKLEGEELGWGFQLQSPYFNLFLLVLFVLIFLNLIDKLPLPDSWADKLSRLSEKTSFLTGFFAVIIACPCTGPFMGAALGYALWQPTPVYFGIFTALAVGYALPYTLIEAFPHFFLRFIPKPGHWMLTLKRILALPIALTCLWLGWVIAHQFAFNTATSTEWEPYSEEAVLQARKDGTPVFIDFTAKWCLVCLLNDKSTLSTKEFKRLVKERKIRLFKADWTNKDETVSKALKHYNRNSIPLYVYYAPHSDTPQILPQILTADIVNTTLTRP
jgi:thiol:disulfide interchange protein DsbD